MYNRTHFGATPRTFGSFIEDAFQNGVNRFNEEVSAISTPVNIQETDKSYELHVVAPGLKKEDFKVNVDRNLLHISYDHKEDKEQTEGTKLLRNEYRTRSFKRTFTLNEKVDTGNISAKYNDGVLYVTLAKKENATQPAQDITVA
jgi:HSP20 family protein